MSAPRQSWIISKRFDLALLVIPLVVSVLSLATLGEAGPDVPLWAFLTLIVAFDVSHVWATLYVSYLDRELFRSHRLLFVLTPLVCFVAALRIHLHSPTLFWTLLAYVAIYHFIKQQWGFIAVYKHRAGEHSTLDYHLDRWTLWAGALGPVLLWHASPARQFDWFNAGEFFIATLDPALRPDVVLLMVLFAGAWGVRQLHVWRTQGRVNTGKVLWMLASWLSWSVGIGLSDHALVSAAFLNLFHGIPFLGLVWYRCNRRWQGRSGGPSRAIAWLSQRRNWVAFYALILALALVEEGLWDAAVWQTYLPSLLGLSEWEPSPVAASVWVALLSVPQTVHYVLDAWIWRLDGSNPDLRELFSPGDAG